MRVPGTAGTAPVACCAMSPLSVPGQWRQWRTWLTMVPVSCVRVSLPLLLFARVADQHLWNTFECGILAFRAAPLMVSARPTDKTQCEIPTAPLAFLVSCFAMKIRACDIGLLFSLIGQ